MTLRTTPDGIAVRTAATSVVTAVQLLAPTKAKLTTMSISLAPLSHACLASAAFVSGLWAPEGNPTTAATLTDAGKEPLARGKSEGEMQIAPTCKSTASTHNCFTSDAVASGASSV